MSARQGTAAHRRLADYLGALGPRWGLPAHACRVHGYLYVVARATSEPLLREALGLDAGALADAIAWLVDYRLIEGDREAGWRTGSDPWELVMRALDERRRRELAPALTVLRECQRELRGGGDAVADAQVGKLLTLLDDIAAIDAQARRLSPRLLRQMVGFGGIAARLIDRTLGRSRS
jgi:DNA-binding transcriptional regulator GbsR (MarR family)